LISCFAIRAAQCAAVWGFGWQVGLLAGLLQFVAAPLSLTGSFIRLFTNLSDCIIHYALNALVLLACAPLLAASPWQFRVKINMVFVIAFFVIDFALNMFVYFRTAESWSAGRLAKHIAYGTFNTKTYFVVVLGCSYGLEFDLLVIVLASLLTWGVSKTGVQQSLLSMFGWPCFPITFYVEHRIGHMPRVYPHAHKMHHYLHDSTSFDAHIYGSGLNEEYFWILAETLPCLLCPGLFPYFLNGTTLHSSWTNKGAHSRTADGVDLSTTGCFDEDNFHADHHTWHRANFGSSTSPLIDFYFGTACPGLKGANGRLYNIHTDSHDSSLLRVLITDAGATSCRLPRESDPALKSGDSRTEAADAQHCSAVAVAENWRSRVVSLKEIQGKRTADAGGPWVALHGAVFDLSTFQKIHPGGAQVLQMYAGTDATKTFDEIGHSEKAKMMAKKRLIGVLEGQQPSDFVADFMAMNPQAYKAQPPTLVSSLASIRQRH